MNKARAGLGGMSVIGLVFTIVGVSTDNAGFCIPGIVFLVIGASILAVNAFHTLMRRGQATKVTSLIYLTPIFAVALELVMFGLVPTAISLAGIAITCAGVAMVSWARPSKPSQQSAA